MEVPEKYGNLVSGKDSAIIKLMRRKSALYRCDAFGKHDTLAIIVDTDTIFDMCPVYMICAKNDGGFIIMYELTRGMGLPREYWSHKYRERIFIANEVSYSDIERLLLPKQDPFSLTTSQIMTGCGALGKHGKIVMRRIGADGFGLIEEIFAKTTMKHLANENFDITESLDSLWSPLNVSELRADMIIFTKCRTVNGFDCRKKNELLRLYKKAFGKAKRLLKKKAKRGKANVPKQL